VPGIQEDRHSVDTPGGSAAWSHDGYERADAGDDNSDCRRYCTVTLYRMVHRESLASVGPL
jgi:hypothetical protein